MDPKAMKPATVSSTNSMTAGIGLRIDQEETLIMASLICWLGSRPGHPPREPYRRG